MWTSRRCWVVTRRRWVSGVDGSPSGAWMVFPTIRGRVRRAGLWIPRWRRCWSRLWRRPRRGLRIGLPGRWPGRRGSRRRRFLRSGGRSVSGRTGPKTSRSHPTPSSWKRIVDLVGMYLNPPGRGGGALCGPQIPDPSPGPNRAHPAPHGRHPRSGAPTTFRRKRRHQPRGRVGYRHRQGHHVYDPTQPVGGVPTVPEPDQPRSPPRPRSPSHLGQRLHPQNRVHPTPARHPRFAFHFTPPTRHRRTSSSAGPPNSPPNRYAAAPTDRYTNSPTPSTTGPNTGSKTHDHSYGTKPPTRYSATSPAIYNEFPRQDTSWTRFRF